MLFSFSFKLTKNLQKSCKNNMKNSYITITNQIFTIFIPFFLSSHLTFILCTSIQFIYVSSIFQPDALCPSFFSPGNLLLGIFGRSTHRPTRAKSYSAVSGLPAKWNNSLWARKSQRIIKRTLQSHQLPDPRAKAQGHLLVPQGTSAELPPLRCTLVFGHERGLLPTLEPQRQ